MPFHSLYIGMSAMHLMHVVHTTCRNYCILTHTFLMFIFHISPIATHQTANEAVLHTHKHTYTESERKRDRERQTDRHTHRERERGRGGGREEGREREMYYDHRIGHSLVTTLVSTVMLTL